MLSEAQNTLSDDSMITNWKEYGRKWSWPNIRYYPSIYFERLRKAMKTLSG
jgi:hypothetical protein